MFREWRRYCSKDKVIEWFLVTAVMINAGELQGSILVRCYSLEQ